MAVFSPFPRKKETDFTSETVDDLAKYKKKPRKKRVCKNKYRRMYGNVDDKLISRAGAYSRYASLDTGKPLTLSEIARILRIKPMSARRALDYFSAGKTHDEYVATLREKSADRLRLLSAKRKKRTEE